MGIRTIGTFLRLLTISIFSKFFASNILLWKLKVIFVTGSHFWKFEKVTRDNYTTYHDQAQNLRSLSAAY